MATAPPSSTTPTPSPTPDPNPNPPIFIPAPSTLEERRTKALEDQALAMKDQVAEQKKIVEIMRAGLGVSGPVQTTTKGDIYFRFLLVCIQAKVGATSNEIQAFAEDMTNDYLTKYPLTNQESTS